MSWLYGNVMEASDRHPGVAGTLQQVYGQRSTLTQTDTHTLTQTQSNLFFFFFFKSVSSCLDLFDGGVSFD